MSNSKEIPVKWTALEVMILVLNMTDTILIQKLHAFNYVVYNKYLSTTNLWTCKVHFFSYIFNL